MNKNKLITIILMIIIIILLYLLILKFGKIENYGPVVPTGNVDIFEINFGFSKDVFNSDKSRPEIGLVVEDNDAVWGNRELRIFSNPAYEYDSIIAPGSSNSYTFVIRNNNTFDIVVNVVMTEENPSGANMKYKLRSQGTYLVGNDKNYEDVSKLNIGEIVLPANSQKSFILDWKWVDSDKDTDSGVSIDNIYKLILNVGIKVEN